ncbi:uncharacterized protein LOC130289957 isoform X3 [Hyla sarda]|uniref:uncharacterized protein LOC130289957 isoform X3 n=1 Tax=Hyla sarda TaxID=327740 RepID=UPI0024C2B477|nr:uncharacterized protein LOC130289957 isoform X3 [Hyla sarda]
MNTSEFLQAGKPVRRSTAGTHLSIGPGNHGKLLLKGDGQNEFQSHASSRRSSGNEQKLAKLQEENDQLKQELEDLRFQYRNLIDEGKNQSLDERRVNLLKSQVLQLERQVMLLTEGLSSRASVLLEFGDALQAVLDKLQSLLTIEHRTPEVQVNRVELIRMIEICQSMQDKLRRNHQLHAGSEEKTSSSHLLCLCTTSLENLTLPWIMSVRQATKNPVSLLDLCYGKVDNLNLLYVAKIECSVSQEFTVENVLAVLPAFPKGAPQQRAKRAAEALVKAANYSRLMAMQQIYALEAELDFHRDIYNLQVQYTQALFQGIKEAYHHFQENVVTVVCSPLKDVLSSYADLKTEASESSLRNFLRIFKNNAEQIQDAVDTLTPSTSQQHEGEEAFSKLGKEFFVSLDNSVKNCREERDRSIFEIEKLRQELNQALDAIRMLKMERKHKGSSSNDQSSKSEGESADGKTQTSVHHTQKEADIPSQLNAFGRKNSLTSPSTEKEIPESQPKQNPSSRTVRHRSKSLQRSKSVRMQPSWQV